MLLLWLSFCKGDEGVAETRKRTDQCLLLFFFRAGTEGDAYWQNASVRATSDTPTPRIPPTLR